ncbi:dienelactone hydrolase family protein [Paludibacterium sp. B53371]|uniref:dienelactone hydrolase family protein n=1 Tax=Paludibacterium sp. B53371 TaxID=2806263 RepID=UPI001C04A060|nr:dienelactone hydrolase family protein [Paludibacterium sp. B53371]
MSANWITINTPQGDSFSAHLARPPTGRGPGIVLIQEIWGVNEHIRAVAEQYALAGFVVLAPDIFWRQQPHLSLDYDQAGSARAFELYGQVDKAKAAADVAATVAHLRSLPQLDGKVATLGFCLGGLLAYHGGILAKADAIVAYYGGGIAQHLALAAELTQPVLFHHGGLDSHITQDQVDQIKQAFQGRSNATFFDYPQAEHGFNCWGRPMYRQRDAALAQGRTLQFLAGQL